jgi:glucan-binding YG repeat protein
VGLILLALPLAAEELAKAAPETALKARAQVFWEARVQEDYAAQYGVLEPKVRRQMSLTNYIQAQGPLQYLEARIEGVQIDEAKGVLTVRTLIRIKHPLLERQSQEVAVQEEWVKRQGEWYRVYPQS